MITDRRVVRWVLGGSAAMGLLLLVAVFWAPEEERAFRSNPRNEPLLAGELTASPPEGQVKSLVYLEGSAALHGDADAALRLWSRTGVIRDANYTLADTTDDRVWVGLDAIRGRYRDEFRERRYLQLSHTDASVFFEGDRAIVVNDLRAEILTLQGVQRVYLSRGDRWTFRKEKNGWRIAELVVNRAPR